MISTLPTCPKCKTNHKVRPKTLLIGNASPKKMWPLEEPAGYQRKDQLAVDECKPEALTVAPLEQFLNAFYCDLCGVGFAPDEVLLNA